MGELTMPQPGQPVLTCRLEDLGSFGCGEPMRCPYGHRRVVSQILDP
jgi:hypothetical protein